MANPNPGARKAPPCNPALALELLRQGGNPAGRVKSDPAFDLSLLCAMAERGRDVTSLAAR